MKLEKELVAASSVPLVLSILSEGDSYGYAIIQEIKTRSAGRLLWTDGMLYPVLHRMEDNGWIKSRWVEMENGRKRKYYSIKRDGHQALKDKREQWTTISSVLGGLWKAPCSSQTCSRPMNTLVHIHERPPHPRAGP